jgi:LAS superfamily LD-carboxypeptidase LdcB
MLQGFRNYAGRITLTQELVIAGFCILSALLVASSVYGYLRITTLSNQVDHLSVELSSTTAHLSDSLSAATSSLSSAIQDTTTHIQSQLGSVQDQVGVIGGTVTDLKKLSNTDPQLLAKYSKVFFLSENYVPSRLVDIPSKYLYNETNNLQLIPQALTYMERMIDDAKAEGVDIFAQSAYRSFKTQAALKTQYTVVYGAGSANKFSADQGYSEHQLGTTIDFITTGTNGALLGFDKRPAYTWLMANAWRYGFILSYPQNNGYYIFEPWHWRFVGVKLSTELHNSNTYFYQMDQRTIDTYLSSFYD